MSIKLLILKSYEDVIAEVSETFSGETLTGYVLTNPYVTKFENGDPPGVSFYPYAPLSADKSISIPFDWVVSVLDPLEEVKKSYTEMLNG